MKEMLVSSQYREIYDIVAKGHDNKNLNIKSVLTYYGVPKFEIFKVEFIGVGWTKEFDYREGSIPMFAQIMRWLRENIVE
jgi:hypothetical protein